MKTGVPDEIVQFQKNRDLCDHFRGEDGYDDQRRKFLAEQYRIYCTGTDEALRNFKLKYKNDKTVAAVLDKYEEKIE